MKNQVIIGLLLSIAFVAVLYGTLAFCIWLIQNGYGA